MSTSESPKASNKFKGQIAGNRPCPVDRDGLFAETGCVRLERLLLGRNLLALGRFVATWEYLVAMMYHRPLIPETSTFEMRRSESAIGGS